MAQRGSKVFTVMVVGDNPEELMAKYEQGLDVDKYIKYHYQDAESMKENSIKILEGIVNSPKEFNMNEFHADYLKERLKALKNMSTFEFYSDLVKGMFIDDNGDAWSTENPNGKWQTFKMGDNLSIPLKLLNGEEVRTALAKDVDWEQMHMVNTKLYEVVWSLIMGKRKPRNEQELTIYNNMKDNTEYFSKFRDVDEYVVHNCAYWNFAYLDKNGWVDIDDAKNDIEWVSNFYERFVEPLEPNDKITIFECTKDKID